MIQIRRNIFETNSSSSHALCVLKKDEYIEGMVDPGWHVNDGRMRFYDDELTFGRAPFQILTDWWGRLCFTIASYANDPAMLDAIEELCYSRIEGLERIEYPKNEWYDVYPNENKYYYGSIDHQSAGMLQDFLRTNHISLEDFIFNNRYLVIIDGDEYNVFDTIMGLPTWNKDAVKEIYYNA